MGQALFFLKRYEEALLHLETAKRIDPMAFSLPGFFIAQIYQIQGQRSRAVEEYREFLKVHPGHPYTPLIESRIRSLQ
jgi:tetratricopeptide (TPR) repeat protein